MLPHPKRACWRIGDGRYSSLSRTCYRMFLNTFEKEDGDQVNFGAFPPVAYKTLKDGQCNVGVRSTFEPQLVFYR